MGGKGRMGDVMLKSLSSKPFKKLIKGRVMDLLGFFKLGWEGRK
jgi:hypothetical protein